MKYLIYGIISLLVLLSSCASTSTNMQSSWQKPNSNFHLSSASKVLVVAMTDNDGQRRMLEDAYATHLSNATPSYAYFNQPLSRVSESSAKSKLNNDGYGAAIVVRLADHQVSGSKRQTSLSVNPSLYYGFGHNWSAGVGVSLRPGYNTRKDQYDIQTSVYEVTGGELVWSGSTLATNPEDMGRLSSTLADEVFSKMQTDGIL